MILNNTSDDNTNGCVTCTLYNTQFIRTFSNLYDQLVTTFYTKKIIRTFFTKLLLMYKINKNKK